MGFEIPIDVDYFKHPKTLRLISLIGPTADIYPLRLWRWAAQYAKKGVIEGGGPAIEAAVGWSGTRGKLSDALREAKFLERDGKTIHDWMEHTGRAILIYDEKKRKQRQKYARDHGILPEESRQTSPYPGHPGNNKQETPETQVPDDPASRNSSGRNHADGAPESGPEGTDDGVAVVVSERKEGDDQDGKPASREGAALLLQVVPRRSFELLREIDLAEGVARALAASHAVGRVFDVVEGSRNSDNRAAWTRRALEEDWSVPHANGPAREQLLRKLEGDAAVLGARLSSARPPRPDFPRLEGESESEWLRRFTEEKKKQRDSKNGGGE